MRSAMVYHYPLVLDLSRAVLRVTASVWKLRLPRLEARRSLPPSGKASAAMAYSGESARGIEMQRHSTGKVECHPHTKIKSGNRQDVSRADTC